MSGHPHKGNRSEWTFLYRQPPEEDGPYERRCLLRPEFGVWVAKWAGFISEGCAGCQWRGLAEKPE